MVNTPSWATDRWEVTSINSGWRYLAWCKSLAGRRPKLELPRHTYVFTHATSLSARFAHFPHLCTEKPQGLIRFRSG